MQKEMGELLSTATFKSVEARDPGLLIKGKSEMRYPFGLV